MKKAAILAVAGLSLLASCQSERPSSQLPRIQQPVTVDGDWIDPSGIVSTFRAGTFNTRTTDTNQLLASGSYVSVSDKMVQINMTSLVRNSQSKVNCAMVTPNQLNCTSDSGAQFSLARKLGGTAMVTPAPVRTSTQTLDGTTTQNTLAAPTGFQ